MGQALARLGIVLADRPFRVRTDLAADAVQEALARAWNQRDRFDPAAGTSPGGWVHGFLQRVLSEQCRSLRKQPAQPPADAADWDRLAARMANDDAGSELAELLARLPDGCRQIVTWHYLDGLPHAEIGELLGISADASRTRLARAMCALKRLAAEQEVGR